MEVQRYRVFELSARAVMSYAVEENGIYKYDLDAAAIDHCLVSSATHEQDSNALFFQILSEIHGKRYKETVTEDVSNELSEIIFYMNFQKVFDTRGLRQREITRQKKAECMFRPEGIMLDFGSGPRRYLAFERSGNMSRESRLSFIREDFFAPVSKRIMMDLEIESCQLSKLYAYNGLMLSSGKRIEGIGIEKKHRVIVVNNPKLKTEREFMVTVRDDGTNNSTRKFYRHEQLEEVNVTCFDGEGLISKAFAEKLDMAYCGQNIHSSFQIRMPYVKGMLHAVDFHDFFKMFHVKMIQDVWGNYHEVEQIDIILTASQFKALGWFRDCKKDWNDYWKAFKKYNHALYTTNVSKKIPDALTQLNYQFLATVSIQPEEFRPADLPGGWDHSPADDERNWLTKATEQLYYDLRVDDNRRRAYFLESLSKTGLSKHSREYIMAAVLRKNPLFLNDPVYTKQLETKAEQILKDYAVGRLMVTGDIRYLSGDLLALLYHIGHTNEAGSIMDIPFRMEVFADQFAKNSFYAPGAGYEKEEHCTLLRNPHIARNEEIQLSVYPEDTIRDSQLFIFAQEKDWQSRLNKRTLERVETLLTDYKECLRRIRSCRSASKENKRKADVERILYRRGQEDAYDTDELYALFQTIDPENLTKLRSAIREENWHMMNESQREDFLVRWLPGADFGEWYDLLIDFRHYGFRVLGDVVGDIDDANNGTDRKQFHRVGDSEAFASMMQAYIDHPRAKYYRDAVARECRDLLRDIVNLNQAVRYIVALGERDLLWELVPDQIEKNVIAVEVDGDAE